MKSKSRRRAQSRLARKKKFGFQPLEDRRLLAALSNGQEISEFVGAGQEDSHTFTVNAGDVVRVAMGEDGTAEPSMTVLNPQSTQVAVDEDNDNAFVTFTAASTGTYTILVSDVNLDDSMSYRLRYISLPGTPGAIAGRDETLSSGEQFSGSFEQGGFNFHPFSVTTGNTVRLAIGDDTNAEVELNVYDASGQLVGSSSGSNNAFIQFQATSGGTYHALVTEGDNDEALDYRIRMLQLGGSSTEISNRDETLSSGETFDSTFPVGSFNFHTFAVTSGDTFRVSVGDDSGGQPHLEIFDEAGNSLGADQGTTNAELQLTAQSTGNYVAVVGEIGNNEALDYRIRFLQPRLITEQLANRDEALSSGEEFTGSFSRGSFNYHQITATAGNTLRIAASESSSSEPAVDVFDPQGNFLQTATGVNSAQIELDVPTTGTYTLLTRENDNDEDITYTIRALEIPGSPQLIGGRDETLSSGEEFAGEVPEGLFNLHRFDVQQGDHYLITAAETVSFPEINLQIYDESGNIVQTDSGSVSATIEATAATTGTYTLIVSDGSNDEALPYQVRFVRIPGANTLISGRDEVLSNGEEFAGAFTNASFNVHSFEVSSGETVRLSIGEDGSAEPLLQVYDDQGNQVATDQSSTNAELQFVTQSSGTYTAIVRDNLDDEAMSYRIRMVRLPGDVGLIADRDQMLTSGNTFSTSHERGGFNVFPFYATAGDAVTFTANESSTARPRVQIFDTTGAFVREDSGNSIASVSFDAAASGTHYAIVNDFANSLAMQFDVTVTGNTGSPPEPPVSEDLLTLNANGQWFAVDGDTAAFPRQIGSWASNIAWEDIAIADFDGDGVDDIIGRNPNNNAWVAGIRGTNGLFFRTIARWSPSISFQDITIADFDGDDRVDIAARGSGGTWVVGISSGTTLSTSAFGVWTDAITWVDVQAADMNGDGRQDIIGRNQASGGWVVAESSGSAFTNRTLGYWAPSIDWTEVRVGDFDGDGDDDIYGRGVGGAWVVARSSGTAIATATVGSWASTINWTDIQLVDLDGDNRADLIGRNGNVWVGSFFSNNLFNTRTLGNWNVNGDLTLIGVADLDADGLDELIGADSSGNLVHNELDTQQQTLSPRAWGQWTDAVDMVFRRRGRD